MSEIWDRGRRDGENDARNAWVGIAWKRPDVKLPADYDDRQDYLLAWAQGFKAYTLSIHNRYEHVDDDTEAMRAERGRGRENLRPSRRTSTRVIAPKGGTP